MLKFDRKELRECEIGKNLCHFGELLKTCRGGANLASGKKSYEEVEALMPCSGGHHP